MKRASAVADAASPPVPGTDALTIWSPLKTAGT
jgi:hypothetical protein